MTLIVWRFCPPPPPPILRLPLLYSTTWLFARCETCHRGFSHCSTFCRHSKFMCSKFLGSKFACCIRPSYLCVVSQRRIFWVFFVHMFVRQFFLTFHMHIPSPRITPYLMNEAAADLIIKSSVRMFEWVVVNKYGAAVWAHKQKLCFADELLGDPQCNRAFQGHLWPWRKATYCDFIDRASIYSRTTSLA